MVKGKEYSQNFQLVREIENSFENVLMNEYKDILRKKFHTVST